MHILKQRFGKRLAASLLLVFLLVYSISLSYGQASEPPVGFLGFKASGGLGFKPAIEYHGAERLNPGYGFVPEIGLFYTKVLRNDFLISVGASLSRPAFSYSFDYIGLMGEIRNEKFSDDVLWQLLSIPLSSQKDFIRRGKVNGRFNFTATLGINISYLPIDNLKIENTYEAFDSDWNILEKFDLEFLAGKRRFIVSASLGAGLFRTNSKRERLEVGVNLNWSPARFGEGAFEFTGPENQTQGNFKVGFGWASIYLKYGFPLIRNPLAKSRK